MKKQIPAASIEDFVRYFHVLEELEASGIDTVLPLKLEKRLGAGLAQY